MSSRDYERIYNNDKTTIYMSKRMKHIIIDDTIEQDKHFHEHIKILEKEATKIKRKRDIRHYFAAFIKNTRKALFYLWILYFVSLIVYVLHHFIIKFW